MQRPGEIQKQAALTPLLVLAAVEAKRQEVAAEWLLLLLLAASSQNPAKEKPLNHVEEGLGERYCNLTDQLGSVTKVTNAAAEVVWSSEYNPFGKTAGIEGLYDFDGSYAGHQPDNDVGLIYAWHRWMDPETGRFISEDPARAGLNYYSYVDGNPILRTDPTGLDWLTDVGDAIGSFFGNLFSGGGGGSGSSKTAGSAPPMPPSVQFNAMPDFAGQSMLNHMTGAMYDSSNLWGGTLSNDTPWSDQFRSSIIGFAVDSYSDDFMASLLMGSYNPASNSDETVPDIGGNPMGMHGDTAAGPWYAPIYGEYTKAFDLGTSATGSTFGFAGIAGGFNSPELNGGQNGYHFGKWPSYNWYDKTGYPIGQINAGIGAATSDSIASAGVLASTKVGWPENSATVSANFSLRGTLAAVAFGVNAFGSVGVGGFPEGSATGQPSFGLRGNVGITGAFSANVGTQVMAAVTIGTSGMSPVQPGVTSSNNYWSGSLAFNY